LVPFAHSERFAGLSTVELNKFKRVIGTDINENILEVAREYAEALGVVNSEYVHGSADDLSFIPEGTVDLVLASLLLPHS
jgi:ubiquinone/menaquinone biosynthesis C-methylase UbiE